MRVIGLLLLLWDKSPFKKLMDACGAFVVVNRDNILAEFTSGRHLLAFLSCGGGFIVLCYAIQSWWNPLLRRPSGSNPH